MEWNKITSECYFAPLLFFSSQSSFIAKFLVDFCDKIRRAHAVLARSKM